MNPQIPENTLATMEFPPKFCSSQCILVYSVYLSGRRHHYAKLNVYNLKIAHHRAAESSRVLRQSHRFWKWVLSKYQTSYCSLERNAPMPGPLPFQKHHCSVTSVNKEHANILRSFAFNFGNSFVNTRKVKIKPSVLKSHPFSSLCLNQLKPI